MSLRTQTRIIWITLLALWLILWFPRSNNPFGLWQFLSLLLVIIIGILLANVFSRRSLQRFQRALAVEDFAAAQREHKNLVDFWRRRGQERIKSCGISILLAEGRYQEALNALQLLDRKKLGRRGVPVIENQIAWCETQIGEPTKAIQIAQTVLPRLESIGPAYSASAHLVLGAANLAGGDATQAVSHLEKAYATSTDSPARRATAAFYLGEALSAMGKTAEARSAYQRAHEALPNGKFGVRALERLT